MRISLHPRLRLLPARGGIFTTHALMRAHMRQLEASRDGLSYLSLSVPVLPYAIRREDGEPITHVDSIDLPQELPRERLRVLKVAQVLLELREARRAEQYRSDRWG